MYIQNNECHKTLYQGPKCTSDKTWLHNMCSYGVSLTGFGQVTRFLSGIEQTYRMKLKTRHQCIKAGKKFNLPSPILNFRRHNSSVLSVL